MNLGVTKELDQYIMWQTKGIDITKNKTAILRYGESLKLKVDELNQKLENLQKIN
jgi:hypothetical protein